MKTTFRYIAITIFTFCGLTIYAKKQTAETRNDFKRYYDQYKVDSSFILYDQNNYKCIVYNQPQTKEQFTPSSIYKTVKLTTNEKLKISHLTGDYYIFTTYRPING